MGIFGESREEKDYRVVCEKAKAWGWNRKAIEDCREHATYRLRDMDAVEAGTASDWHFHYHFDRIADLSVAIRHPKFPVLLVHMLGSEQPRLNEIARISDFAKALSEADREQIRLFVLTRAKDDNHSALVDICEKAGWLDDLEALWRNRPDSYDWVYNLLRHRKKWDACVSWCREHRQFWDCLSVLEESGRFDEAVDLLAKLGWAAWLARSGGTEREAKREFQCEITKLRGLAAAAGQTDAKPSLNPAGLEDRYAYGEISKVEYEKLKSQAAKPTAKTCANCGQPVDPAHKFCPHCGANNARE